MGNKKRFWLNSFRGVSVFRNILIMPNATYEYDLKIVILSCLKDFESIVADTLRVIFIY